jgi:hypothetical protein
MIMGQLFEQQPKESAKAFAAFSEYLNLGAERSLAAVGQRLGKSRGQIEKLSARWRWGERVKAFDANLALVERQATEAAARSKSAEWLSRQVEQRDAEWSLRNELVDLARAAIARWKANEKRCGSLEGIARLLDLASKLGRLASGMPTDRTEITGEDGGPIRLELNAALNKVYGEVVDVEALPAPEPLPQGEAEGNGLPGQRANGNPVTGCAAAPCEAPSAQQVTP